MEMLLLYYVLLVLWVPLLWPAMRLRGWQRGALLMVILAGVLATASEVWQSFGTANAIRIDILLFSVVLVVMYTAGVAVLLLARWRVLAFALGAIVLLTAGAMGYRWTEAMAEGDRLRAKLDTRDELIFRAKFRNAAVYDAYFGPFDTPAGGLPAGHWQADDPSRFPRLIVNGAGQAWLFYRCGTTECAFGPSNRPLERVLDGAAREWQGLLKPVIGELLPVRIVQHDETRLSVEAQRQRVAFTKAPPPLDPAPQPDALRDLGSFSASVCTRKHAAVRQVWLWRQDDRVFAVGVFRTLVAGQRALFVTPSAMGEGRRDGDAWTFDWKQEGEPAHASIALGGEGATLTLTLPHRQSETVTLQPGVVFQDETIALAPRSGAEDWRRWFDTVWTGHFFSGSVAACPG